MAINITKKLVNVNVQLHGAVNPAEGAQAGELLKPALVASYEVTIDDPDDDMLPVVNNSTKIFVAEDADGNPTDMSNEDARLQAIAAAVWAE